MFSKFKRLLIVSLVFFATILSVVSIVSSQAPQASVQLTTEPAIAQAIPLEAEATEYLGSGKYNSPVRLKLQARDATGTLANAQFHLQIFTPAPTPWFTTDFPITEGTKLLDIIGNAPTGEFSIQQVFPIRGQYKLQVGVTPTVANSFAPINQTLDLTLAENPLKLQYFPVVLAVLLTIGFGGGWIIGGGQTIKAGEIAPRRVRLLLSGVTILAIAVLTFFNINAEWHQVHAQAQAEGKTEISQNSGLIQSQGLKLELTGDDATAVGQLASFQVKLTDSQTNQSVSDAIFKLKSTQLENKWVAFAYEGVPNAQGVLAWQEQFFDGAPHRVEVEVAANPNSDRQFQPFQAIREIEVEGIAPPMFVRLVSLFYFVTVLSMGLVAGLWLQRRRLSH
jgi:hypothetical protein